MSRNESELRDTLARLDRRAADHVDLRRLAADTLRRHIGFDVAVLATIDPTTVMWTHCLLDGMDRDEALEEEVFRNEYGTPDVLKLVDLQSTPGHAGTLVVAAGDAPAPSERLEVVYRPRGITDELRVLLVDGDSPWGALCLLRSGGTFGTDDLTVASGVGPVLAVMLRRSLLKAAVDDPQSLDVPPGLLVCAADGRVDDMTDEARRLVDALGTGEVPQVVAALRAKQAAGARAEAAVATRDGRWLAFHATRMGEREVVIVEQVRAHRLADLIVRSRGLTARERDVVECVARGLSTRDIAAALFISEYTVQDHLKSVFAKFGVRSRQELVAAVFFDHYGPRHATEDTPSPYGWYLERSVR